jgi:hypothetical protein
MIFLVIEGIQVKKEDYDYIYDLVKSMFSSDETTVKPDDVTKSMDNVVTTGMSTDLNIDTTTTNEVIETTTLVNINEEASITISQMTTLQPTTIMKDENYDTTSDSMIVSTTNQRGSESTTVGAETDSTTEDNITANEVLDVRELESTETFLRRQ